MRIQATWSLIEWIANQYQRDPIPSNKGAWWWQTLMLNLPLSFRQKKAAKIRAHSNQSKKMKSQAIMDVNERAVSDMFIKFNVSQMIHGHTHRPNVHKYDNNKTRYVLGDWYTDLWYIEASHEGLELIKEPL